MQKSQAPQVYVFSLLFHQQKICAKKYQQSNAIKVIINWLKLSDSLVVRRNAQISEH
jgi:hypothetical protein